jgi:hypothetical protein
MKNNEILRLLKNIDTVTTSIPKLNLSGYIHQKPISKKISNVKSAGQELDLSHCTTPKLKYVPRLNHSVRSSHASRSESSSGDFVMKAFQR